jgi:hypothetical protein
MTLKVLTSAHFKHEAVIIISKVLSTALAMLMTAKETLMGLLLTEIILASTSSLLPSGDLI